MCHTGQTPSEIWNFDLKNTKRKLSEIWDLDSKLYTVVEIGLALGSRVQIVMALHLHLLQFYTYTYIYLYLYRLLLATTSILLLSLRLFHADPTEYFLPTTPYRLLPTYSTLYRLLPTLLLTDHSLPTTHFQITSNQQLSATVSLLLHPPYP